MSTNLMRPSAPITAVVASGAPPDSATDTDKKTPTRKPKVFPPFKEFILATLRAIELEGKDHEQRRLKEYVENHNFYAGRQIGYVSTNTYEWMDTQGADDPYQIDNIVQPTVDILETEMSRVRIELKVVPKRTDEPKSKEGAAWAEEKLRDELKRIKDPFFTQRENKFAIITGDYYRYTGTEDDVDAVPLRVPKVLKGEVSPQSTGLHVCPECGDTEPAEAFAPEDEAEAKAKLCPSCLTAMNLVKSGPLPTVNAEYEERPPRRVFTIACDPASVKISPKARRGVKDSPYVWLKLRVTRGMLEEEHPDKEIPSTGVKSEALQYQKSLEEQANRTNGADIWDESKPNVQGGDHLEEIELDLIWLDPTNYGGYTFPRRTELPSGRIVEAGQKLKETHPLGLFISKTGDELLDDAEESKRDKWSSGVYRMIPTSAHGGNISGVINDQKQINELRNLDFYDALYNGSGREIYNPGKISGGKLSGDPSVAVAAENLDDGDSLLSAVAVRLPGTNGIPSAERLNREINASVQNKTGAMPTNLSASSVDTQALGTATGITAQSEAFHGRMEPSQVLRAQVDEEHGIQVLIAMQTVLKEKAAADPSILADTGLRYFIEADVRRDYRLEATPGSWMPVTETQRMGYFESFLKIASIPNLPRQYVNYAAELLKIPFIADPFDAVRQDAEVRLEEILKTAKMVEEETEIYDADNNILPDAVARVFKFADAPVDVENDKHGIYIEFLQEWLLSQEARKASKFERECVKARLKEHRVAMVEQAQNEERSKLAAQAPQLEAKDMQDAQQLEADKQRMALEQEAKAAEAEQQHELETDAAEHQLGAQLIGGAAEAVGAAALQ